MDNQSDLTKMLGLAVALIGKLKAEVYEKIDNISLLAGPKGERGDQGENGKQGLRGDIGIPGQKGDGGEVGPKGDRGTQGEKGDTGETGEQGIQGVVGEVGPQGIQGIQGETGEKGDVGPQGIQGIKGDTGEKGDIGTQGIQGPDGKVGKQGTQGKQGKQGVRGEKGLKGVKGDKGAKGDRGVQGPVGIQGERGIDGAKGEKGETGPAGVDAKVTSNDLKPFVDDLNKKYKTFSDKISTDIRKHAMFGSGAGGGSVKILDNDDVVMAYPEDLSDNTILVFDVSIKKFVTQRLSDVINEIKAELELKFTKLIDDVNDDGLLLYIGEADPNTATSAALWRIQKVVISGTSDDITITWAGGTSAFDKIYDDRASYTYS